MKDLRTIRRVSRLLHAAERLDGKDVAEWSALEPEEKKAYDNVAELIVQSIDTLVDIALTTARKRLG